MMPNLGGILLGSRIKRGPQQIRRRGRIKGEKGEVRQGGEERLALLEARGGEKFNETLKVTSRKSLKKKKGTPLLAKFRVKPEN